MAIIESGQWKVEVDFLQSLHELLSREADLWAERMRGKRPAMARDVVIFEDDQFTGPEHSGDVAKRLPPFGKMAAGGEVDHGARTGVRLAWLRRRRRRRRLGMFAPVTAEDTSQLGDSDGTHDQSHH
jgi:hypothetical protein